MNAREREEYLREYSVLKNQGKPFFPYAIAKDSLMGCIVLGVIIAMSIILGAELGPKADPTTTTYTPRPEWYFFFLFSPRRRRRTAVRFGRNQRAGERKPRVLRSPWSIG